MSLFTYNGAISREEALAASAELIPDEDSDEEYEVCKEALKPSTKRKNESEESSPRPTKKPKANVLSVCSDEDEDLKNLLSSIDDIPEPEEEKDDDDSSSLEILTPKKPPPAKATGSNYNTRSSRRSNNKPIIDLLDSDEEEDDVYGDDEEVEEVITNVTLTLKVSQKSDASVMKVITKNGQLPKPMKFKLGMDQKFSNVVDLAKKILGVERISDMIVELKLDGVLTVPLDDTPASQSITSDEELTIKFSLPEGEDDDLLIGALPQKVATEDRIRIKIRNGKVVKKYRLGKTDKFDKLYAKLATEYKVDKSNVKLKFDGDIIELDETPEELDMEDDDQIDCTVR